MDQAQVMQVIKTTLTRRGNGQDDPIRIITQYWTLEGELLAEVDPITKSTEPLEEPRLAKRTYKKRDRKPKADHPWIGKRRGRPPKQVNDFLCLNCGKPFKTNLGELDAKCIYCGSREIERGDRNSNVVED